jgi:hypothetical protein
MMEVNFFPSARYGTVYWSLRILAIATTYQIVFYIGMANVRLQKNEGKIPKE